MNDIKTLRKLQVQTETQNITLELTDWTYHYVVVAYEEGEATCCETYSNREEAVQRYAALEAQVVEEHYGDVVQAARVKYAG